MPSTCSGCSCWLSCSLLKWFFLHKNHLPRHRESGNLLCFFFGRPRVFSFLIILSCHWNLHNSCFSFIFLLLSWAHSANTSPEFATRQFLFFQVLFIKFWCSSILVMVTSLLLISGTFRFLTPSLSEDLDWKTQPPWTRGWGLAQFQKNTQRGRWLSCSRNSSKGIYSEEKRKTK